VQNGKETSLKNKKKENRIETFLLASSMKRFIVEIFGVGAMCLHNTYKKI
jgi:hypothetical protein